MKMIAGIVFVVGLIVLGVDIADHVNPPDYAQMIKDNIGHADNSLDEISEATIEIEKAVDSVNKLEKLRVDTVVLLIEQQRFLGLFKINKYDTVVLEN